MSERIISVVEKKAIIIDFLRQCNQYSEEMLKKYQQPSDDEQLQQAALQKIHDWNVYKDFNEFAIGELSGDALDDWFK